MRGDILTGEHTLELRKGSRARALHPWRNGAGVKRFKLQESQAGMPRMLVGEYGGLTLPIVLDRSTEDMI